MKKLIMGAVLAVVLAAASFAQAGYSTLGAHVSLPISIASSKYSVDMGYGIVTETLEYKTKSTTTSIGFGINGMSMFTDFIGLYSTMDISFALSGSDQMTVNDVSGEKTKWKRKDVYKSQIGVDMLIGPAFKLLYTDSIFLYAAPGLHYQMSASKQEFSFAGYSSTVSSTGGYLGVGASINADFSVASKLAIQAGVDTAFDFFAFGDNKIDDGKQKVFVISPKIGVAYKF